MIFRIFCLFLDAAAEAGESCCCAEQIFSPICFYKTAQGKNTEIFISTDLSSILVLKCCW
jgi:hypothetical protein